VFSVALLLYLLLVGVEGEAKEELRREKIASERYFLLVLFFSLVVVQFSSRKDAYKKQKSFFFRLRRI